MTEHLITVDHIALWASIVLPLGGALILLIWRTGQTQLKVDTMWEWFTNHGHELTGYKPGDEHKRRQ